MVVGAGDVEAVDVGGDDTAEEEKAVYETVARGAADLDFGGRGLVLCLGCCKGSGMGYD